MRGVYLPIFVNSISKMFSEGEDPNSELGKIIGFVGISGSAAEKMYSIGDAFVDYARGKFGSGKVGLLAYYIGIVLAFAGMLADSATATLHGDLLKWADLAAVIISSAGLIFSLWMLKRDIANKAREEISPLIVLIELAIGTCGVVSSVAKYVHDNGGV